MLKKGGTGKGRDRYDEMRGATKESKGRKEECEALREGKEAEEVKEEEKE
jgi:hypothetical protein